MEWLISKLKGEAKRSVESMVAMILSPTDQNQQHLPNVYGIPKSNSVI